MNRYALFITLVANVMGQDRYWGSYSASYPAGGSGSSASVASQVANLQEASRQAISQPNIPVVAKQQKQQQRFVASQTTNHAAGGYTHNPAGDTGQAYVHDTTGDHGPYYYWKLRQQAKAKAAGELSAAPAPASIPVAAPEPTQAPRRQVVTVRRQRPIQTPVVQRPQIPVQRQPAPVNFHQQQYYQPQAPVQPTAHAYSNDFSSRAYAYTAPTYSAQAQGSSFSYEAVF